MVYSEALLGSASLHLFARLRSWIPFQTDELQKSLEHQKDSLQELSVTHSYYNFDLSEEDDIDPMSFVKFMALRVLEISLAFVFGGDVVCYDEGTVHRLKDIDDPSEAQQRECAERLVEMLPESLETIRFAQCGDEWTTRLLDRALLRVLEVGAELLPRLRTIEVHVYQGMEEAIVQGGGPLLEKSFQAAKDAGLGVEVVYGSRLCVEDPYDMEDYHSRFEMGV